MLKGVVGYGWVRCLGHGWVVAEVGRWPWIDELGLDQWAGID